LGPDRRFVGADRTGLVQVELDGTAREVDVHLAGGWRSRVGIQDLGAAVVQAFAAAAVERLSEWAAGAHPADLGGGVGAGSLQASEGGAWAGPLEAGAALVLRAWRDVREYQVRLDELHASARRVAGPDGQVVVTVRGGQLVDVELNPAWWRASVSVADLEQSLGKALCAGLAAIANTPDLALAGCPDLQALLTGSFLSRSDHQTSPNRATWDAPQPEPDGLTRQQRDLHPARREG
jgi:hypothetical protein